MEICVIFTRFIFFASSMVKFLSPYTCSKRKYSHLSQDEDSTSETISKEECVFDPDRITHKAHRGPLNRYRNAIWAIVLLSFAVIIIILSFYLGTAYELASDEFVKK